MQLETQIMFSRLFRLQISHRVTTIIQDEQFLFNVILPQEILDRPRLKSAAIVGRDDAGDEQWALTVLLEVPPARYAAAGRDKLFV